MKVIRDNFFNLNHSFAIYKSLNIENWDLGTRKVEISIFKLYFYLCIYQSMYNYREQGEHPKLEYQYSTPLSAVPSHLKMLKVIFFFSFFKKSFMFYRLSILNCEVFLYNILYFLYL